MIKSESIKEIAKALSSLQGEIHDAQIDSENPHFKSAYASLESYLKAIRPLMFKHGLSISQGGNGERLKTYLMHTSGEYLAFEMILVNEKKTMQGLGSAVSYARRYSLGALLGIGESDDDGEAERKEKEAQDAKKAAELRAGQKDSPGSGDRKPNFETGKSGIKAAAQDKGADESKTQSPGAKPQVRDETPITFSMTLELDQKILNTKRDQKKTYEWICKKYHVGQMIQLKSWQFDEIMGLLNKPA